MNKLESLKELREKVSLSCYGTDRLSSNDLYVFVANHNCLLDVFYLPMSLDFPIMELISCRLMFNKEDAQRFNMINDNLYCMPIEAHGGSKYSNLCLSAGVETLKNGGSISIFPEGAYIPEQVIHRGRTGATRILYDAVKLDLPVKLVPVAINAKHLENLDSYEINGGCADIYFLDPINYAKSFEDYISAKDYEQRNKALHEPLDEAMANIAACLHRPLDLKYISLFPKGNIMAFDGTKIPLSEIDEQTYNKYEQDLSRRLQKEIKHFKN